MQRNDCNPWITCENRQELQTGLPVSQTPCLLSMISQLRSGGRSRPRDRHELRNAHLEGNKGNSQVQWIACEFPATARPARLCPKAGRLYQMILEAHQPAHMTGKAGGVDSGLPGNRIGVPMSQTRSSRKSPAEDSGRCGTAIFRGCIGRSCTPFPGSACQTAPGTVVDTVTRPVGKRKTSLSGFQCGFTLHGQKPGHEMVLSGPRTGMRSGGASPGILDTETRQCRRSTLKDLHDAARLVDVLDNIHFFSGLMTAVDMPDEQTLNINTACACLSDPIRHGGSGCGRSRTLLDSGPDPGLGIRTEKGLEMVPGHRIAIGSAGTDLQVDGTTSNASQ